MDTIRVIVFLGILVLVGAYVYALTPSAGSINEESSVRGPAGTPDSDGALAGNLTELTITGFSLSQAWQGYFGNVTGTIQLSDASDKPMYNWTLSNPKGEVYATTLNSVTWAQIQCFNFTASNTRASELQANYGGTSKYGMNLNAIETAYNIDSDDVDGVNETFALTDGSGYNHTAFYSNNLEFSAGECLSVHLFGAGGVLNNDYFEEVLLYDPAGEQPIFVSLLDDSRTGFDDRAHDFEMLVLDDGHGTDTSTTTYYFYVELE